MLVIVPEDANRLGTPIDSTGNDGFRSDPYMFLEAENGINAGGNKENDGHRSPRLGERLSLL